MIPTPFAHQKQTLKLNAKTPIFFDASDAGTGKTATRIWRFAERRKKNGKCILVLGLRSTLASVWAADFKKFAPALKTSVATAANREAAFAVTADAYITNHDAVKWLAKQPPKFFARFDEVVIDESEFFKHYTSQRSRAMLKIIKHFTYRTCMSATPNDNSIVDIWHQALLLDGGKRLGKLYSQFRQSVCTPVQEYIDEHGITQRLPAVIWEDKEGAEDAVFGLLSDIVVRHRLDDCADIPENHQYPLTYEMSPAQKKAYMQLEATKIIDLDALGGITAINAAAVATKLLQVASGAVYSSPEKYHVIDTGRYELVLDLVQQRKHPLVLFLWKHQRDLLVAEATRRGLKFAVFDGETSDADRTRYVQQYQAGLLDLLIAHPRTAGHGLTLTKGTSTIWASPTHIAAQFIQASSRQRRIGQTEKTETIVIVAEGTADEWAYENCMNKTGRMSSLLDLFASLTPKKPAKKVATA